MPENTINKHGYSFPRKGHIRFTEEGIGPAPACDFLIVEESKKL